MRLATAIKNPALAGWCSLPKRTLLFVPLVFLLCACAALSDVTGCGKEAAAKQEPPVVAGLFGLYDFARQIGGDKCGGCVPCSCGRRTPGRADVAKHMAPTS